jgi:hypothetical protein
MHLEVLDLLDIYCNHFGPILRVEQNSIAKTRYRSADKCYPSPRSEAVTNDLPIDPARHHWLYVEDKIPQDAQCSQLKVLWSKRSVASCKSDEYSRKMNAPHAADAIDCSGPDPA